MSAVMVSMAVLIRTFSSGILAGRGNMNLIVDVTPIERNDIGLHLENEVARPVAADYHRLMFVESQRVHT